MRQKQSTEILTGLIVAVLVVLASMSMFDTADAGADTYRITAKYPQVDGITVGSDVMAAGILVGKVVDLALDENYFAVLTMEIDRVVELDSDASAQIVSSSIFGAKYVRLDIGGGDFTIEPGGRVFYTEQAMILQDLLDQVIALGRSRQQKKAEHDTPKNPSFMGFTPSLLPK